ncbi:DUF1566 domain-containing protein [Acinetobacter sp. TUM15071]|uniref:Lcl C-terminal domain-containing protein n=1 Tax=Acinetobacter sp. TUM15071 TaxID=2609135 RepID=UPI00124E5FAA|nr:DUF1566 domain-containing protein [Acinetobacter sp. TUM15071]
MKKIVFTTINALLFIGHAHAQTCNLKIATSAPNNRYEIVASSDGREILDKQTKLIWQRCSIGQIWDGQSCAGTPTQLTWDKALIKAKALNNGYRLPNIKELQSIVEESCREPAINEKIFPNTNSSRAEAAYWTSSPIPLGNNVWVVDFNNGSTFFPDKDDSEANAVRAVRSSK